MSKHKAIIFLLILAFVKSTGYILNDIALKHVSVLQLQTIHFFITALLMWVFFFKRVRKADKKTLIIGAILGIIFFLGMTFQTAALETTTVSKNSFLSVMNVVFISIISYFLFKQKITADYVVGIVIMFIGFFLLLFKIDFFHLASSLEHLKNEANFVVGDFYTIVSALIFAVHVILIGRSVNKHDALALVTIQMSIAALLSLSVSLVQKDSIFNLSNQINLAYIGIIIGIISGVVGLFTFSSQMYLQKFVLPSTAAIILSTEPLFASALAVVLGLDNLTIAGIIGGILVTIGIIITQVDLDPKKPLK